MAKYILQLGNSLSNISVLLHFVCAESQKMLFVDKQRLISSILSHFCGVFLHVIGIILYIIRPLEYISIVISVSKVLIY